MNPFDHGRLSSKNQDVKITDVPLIFGLTGKQHDQWILGFLSGSKELIDREEEIEEENDRLRFRRSRYCNSVIRNADEGVLVDEN